LLLFFVFCVCVFSRRDEKKKKEKDVI